MASLSGGQRLPGLEVATPSLGPTEKARPAMRTCAPESVPSACGAHAQPPSPSRSSSSTAGAGSVPCRVQRTSTEGLREHTRDRATRDLGHRDRETGSLVVLGVKTTRGHTATLTERSPPCPGRGRVPRGLV